MSTEFINDQWRLPNNENKDKQSNYSMDFDGSSQYVDTPQIDLGSTNSISFWINNTASNSGTLFGDPNTYNTTYALSWSTTANILSFRLGNGNNGYWQLTVASGLLKDGNWHHHCLTRDGVTINYYIDGVLQTNVTNNTLNASAGTNTTIENVMARSNATSFASGKLDGVAIFNYALSQGQVTTLYGSSSTGIGNPMSLSPKPVASYNLGDQDAFNGANYLVPNIAAEEADGDIAASYSPYALDFDSASSQYIQTNVDLAYTTFPNISLACWVKMNKSDLSNYTIYHPVGVFTNLFPNGSPIRIYSQAASSGGSSVVLVQGSTSAQTSTDLADGNWHHIVQTCEYDSGGTICNVYVDGTKEINNHSLVSYAPLSGNLFIGSRDSSAGFFLGSISNASIWNTALTSAQVSEIYNEGVPSNLNNHSAYSNLVSWWQLGSNSSFNTNWTVLDEVTASGNNGTSVNMGEDSIVDGVGSSANGLSSGMGGDEVIGDAPYSSSNSLSVNMDVLDRVTDTPS